MLCIQILPISPFWLLILRVICPTMHDLRKKENETLETRIMNEENFFENLVVNLPHRAYGIHQLEKIQTSVLAGIKPPPVDTSWLKDPTAITPTEQWSAKWNPNRRIHIENALRHGRLPSITNAQGPTLRARKTKGQLSSNVLTKTSRMGGTKSHHFSSDPARSHSSHRYERHTDRRKTSVTRHSQNVHSGRGGSGSSFRATASGRQHNVCSVYWFSSS